LPDLDEVAVGAGHELAGHLDHGYARAQRRIHGGHLQPDDAAADDEHALRHGRQRERARAVDDARVVGQKRQAHGLAARGDDRALEGDGAALAGFFLRGAAGFFDHDAVRARKAAIAAHDLHLAHLGHRAQSAREPAYHLGFVRAQLLEVDLRRAERHAGARQVARLVDHRGHVQQGFRGNAAHVEAHAAELA